MCFRFSIVCPLRFTFKFLDSFIKMEFIRYIIINEQRPKFVLTEFGEDSSSETFRKSKTQIEDVQGCALQKKFFRSFSIRYFHSAQNQGFSRYFREFPFFHITYFCSFWHFSRKGIDLSGIEKIPPRLFWRH